MKEQTSRKRDQRISKETREIAQHENFENRALQTPESLCIEAIFCSLFQFQFWAEEVQFRVCVHITETAQKLGCGRAS